MDKPTVLTEKSWVPLGAAFTMATMISSAAWWCSSLYSRISVAETRIQANSFNQGQMVEQLQKMNLTLSEIQVELKLRRAYRERNHKGE